jgi:membrane protein
MPYIKSIFELLRDAGQAWAQDKASLLAAAIAYYTVFSLAPLLVFSVAMAGFFFGEAAVEGQIVTQIEGAVGREAAVLIEGLIENAQQGGGGVFATIISTALLFLGASGVFNQLKAALNRIWGIQLEPAKGLQGVINLVRMRALGFAMVLFIGLLLVAALTLNVIVATLGHYLVQLLPELGPFLRYVNLFVTPIIMVLLFAILFKTLPDARVAWRDVWLGAAVTTLLFALGVYLISFYLRRSSAGSVYGAASSLIVLLLFIYYAAQILLYGAEFTKVFANRFGKRIKPANNAVFIAERYREAAEPTPAPEPVRWAEVETAVAPPPPPPRQRQVAVGLLGLAVGLFLGYVGSLRR